MQDFLHELAETELKSHEVREILRRLAIQEFGGPDVARVKDVAEAASVSSEAVGRMLAEIRGESFAEWRTRFESKVDDHGRRISTLEEKPDSALNDVELYERVERGRRQKAMEMAGPMVVISLIGAVVVMAVISYISSGPHYSTDQWYPGTSFSEVNGHRFGYDGGCNWAEAKPDGAPGPIVHQQDAIFAEYSVSKDGGRCR